MLPHKATPKSRTVFCVIPASIPRHLAPAPWRLARIAIRASTRLSWVLTVWIHARIAVLAHMQAWQAGAGWKTASCALRVNTRRKKEQLPSPPVLTVRPENIPQAQEMMGKTTVLSAARANIQRLSQRPPVAHACRAQQANMHQPRVIVPCLTASNVQQEGTLVQKELPT